MTKAPTDGNSPIETSGPSAEHLAKSAESAANKTRSKGLPPVHLWHPPFSGDMDMRITCDGQWVHEGRPITRDGLVRLFASILRYDDGSDGGETGYMLVTPAERFRIQVDDVPFVAEAVDITGDGRDQTLTFTTNLGDVTTAGPDAPLRVVLDPETGEPTPYVRVRGGLDARIDRKSFYHLIDRATHEDHDGGRWFGLWSAGRFFPIIPSDALEE
ncbi:DUF1285 domain-containing protein [Aliiroseovarius crassostreae]|uniref:DUF1285 domain-containing protein n=1 Tax=Aliiroseovarius crassostreae TaxID=154981 RepID=UPI003C7BEAA1